MAQRGEEAADKAREGSALRSALRRAGQGALPLLAAAWTMTAAPAHGQVEPAGGLVPVQHGTEAIETQEEQDAAERRRQLSRRPDERRPAQQFTTTLFGSPLILGGQYEVTHLWRENEDLDRDFARDRSRLDQELKLEAFHRTTDKVSVFLQAVGVSEIETHREGGDRADDTRLERGQMWVYVDPLVEGVPVALQAGRVGLVEQRTWWWDEDLDAIRVYLGVDDWLVDTGVARELGKVSTLESHVDAEREGVNRWFGRAAWAWRSRHSVEGYWLLARDTSSRHQVGSIVEEDRTDESDGRLRWFGLRAQGDERFGKAGRLGYWLDTGWVRGRDHVTVFSELGADRMQVVSTADQRVRGHALDAGVMWTFPAAWRPTVTLAYARGSGDGDPDDGVDENFRQTGLQENKGRYRGVNRFRYYGEALRPELSNLAVATGAFGFRFLPRSSLEFVFHDYRQVRAAGTLRDTRLDADPDGVHRHLGQELDVILGVRESRRLEFAARAGVFRAGEAFGPLEGERAWYFDVSLTFVF